MEGENRRVWFPGNASKEVMFALRPTMRKSRAKIERKGVPGIGCAKCTGPEEGTS